MSDDDDDDHDIFSQAMHKVKPIQQHAKVCIEKAKVQRAQYKNKSQYTSPKHSRMASASTDQRLHDTDDAWLWVADGVSRDSIKRLAGGSPPIGLNIDLHGYTRDAALSLLHDAVQQALSQQIRVLCIVHGRGLHSEGGKAVLKEAVYHWLASGPLAHLMLAAIPQPGSGGGACVLLLRRLK